MGKKGLRTCKVLPGGCSKIPYKALPVGASSSSAVLRGRVGHEAVACGGERERETNGWRVKGLLYQSEGLWLLALVRWKNEWWNYYIPSWAWTLVAWGCSTEYVNRRIYFDKSELLKVKGAL